MNSLRSEEKQFHVELMRTSLWLESLDRIYFVFFKIIYSTFFTVFHLVYVYRRLS